MPSSAGVLSLISRPFGPYPEAAILPNDFNDIVKRKKPQLRSVYMSARGKETGLDHTEYVGTPPEDIPAVTFYGILVIKELKWLSPQGLDWLQADLRERDVRARRKERGDNDVVESELTLKSLYGTAPAKGSKISVWISCKKNHQASFLSHEGFEEDLVFISEYRQSRDKKLETRLWRIRSLNVITTSLSRNYLERWRFLRFVKNLVKAHPKVPQKHITPYFIMRAMQARYTEGADHHRHVFDEQLDSDVDENGNTTLLRSLRHVSSSEVYSIMATHCQWFLAQQLVTYSPHHTHVNLKLWYAFCKEVAQAMKKNKALGRNGRKSWGKPYQPEKKGNETSSRQQNEKKADSLIDLKPFGMVDGGWERRIRKRCIDIVYPQDTDSDVEDNVEMEVEDDDVDAPGRPEYDDELSETSSPSEYDSDESDSDFDEIFRHVPRWMLTPPVTYPGQLSWTCPDRDCDYSVDVRNMPKSVLSDAEYQFLQNPFSVSNDEKRQDRHNHEVQQLLFRVLSEHYFEHGRSLGFVHVVKGIGKNGIRQNYFRRVGDEDDIHQDIVVKNEMDL